MTARVRAAIVAGGVAAVVAFGVVFIKRAREASPLVSGTIDLLANPGDTSSGSALFGRQRAQREILVEMQTHLARLVALDSTFVHDATYPQTFFQRAQTFSVPHRSNYTGPYLSLLPNGWVAKIEGWPFVCAVSMGPDTSIRGAAPGTPVCYAMPKPGEPDSTAYYVLMRVSIRDDRELYEAPLGDNLIVRARREMHANGTHMGWTFAVNHKTGAARSRNLLFHSLGFHGPHPADMLAWIHQRQLYPDKRLLEVYGEPYDILLDCISCTTAGDGEQVHFTDGRIDVYWRQLPAPNEAQLRP